jgi:hypothetical protein
MGLEGCEALDRVMGDLDGPAPGVDISALVLEIRRGVDSARSARG